MKLKIISIISFLGALNPMIAKSEEPGSSVAADAQTSIQRKISIRAYEIFQERKLRIHLILDESDGSGRYLLNTLDAKSFRLQPEEASEPPIEPTSLSTFANRSPAAYRETAVVFEANKEFSERQFDSIRSAVAGFLGGFRSDVLSVRATTEEKESRLAWIAPGQSENPRAIQKSILESPSLDGKAGVAAGVCAAMKELESESPPMSPAQRSLILISRAAGDGSSGWSEARKCLAQAIQSSVRIFWVRIRDLESQQVGKFDSVIEGVVDKSGGFVGKLTATSDPVGALSNLRSYLDDEYILEFDFTQYRPYSDILKFSVSANYHGNIYRSAEHKYEGFVAKPRPEELERVEQARESARIKERQAYYFISAVLLLSSFFIVYFLRRNTAGCKKCGFRVSSSFQDCPFRNAKCHGRMSVIQGPGLGSEFPLFSGENSFGSSRSNTIRWKAKGLARKHGTIVITKRKALFSPARGSQTRVNGVMATEPRLLSSGSILRIGDVVCRVDFKEGA